MGAEIAKESFYRRMPEDKSTFSPPILEPGKAKVTTVPTVLKEGGGVVVDLPPVKLSPEEERELQAEIHGESTHNGAENSIPVISAVKKWWNNMTHPIPHSNISSAVTEVSEPPDETMAPDPRFPKK